MRSRLVDASEHPDWGTMREIVISMMYRRAKEAGAEVHFGTSVVDVVEDGPNAYVLLDENQRLEADLIIGADGIRSRIRSKILAHVKVSTEPLVSDVTFYNIQLDAKDVLSDPKTARLADETSSNLTVFMGRDRFVVARFNGKLPRFSPLVGIRGETDQRSMWDKRGDIDYVRKCYKRRCTELAAALKKATKCDRWKLAEMPDLPRWTSKGGRIILLGDSAHGPYTDRLNLL
jgi:salicylate hydroxylase